MTQEEKQIKLLEFAGWKCIALYDDGVSFYQNEKGEIASFPASRNGTSAPDYFRDLNATNELEKVLRGTEEQYYKDPMVNRRWKMYQCDLMQKFGASATAAERAEELGKAFNLW